MGNNQKLKKIFTFASTASEPIIQGASFAFVSADRGSRFIYTKKFDEKHSRLATIF